MPLEGMLITHSHVQLSHNDAQGNLVAVPDAAVP